MNGKIVKNLTIVTVKNKKKSCKEPKSKKKNSKERTTLSRKLDDKNYASLSQSLITYHDKLLSINYSSNLISDIQAKRVLRKVTLSLVPIPWT